ncbi:MAG: hypothetical protein SGJ02_06095 [bacterium]|nr:hypothetical protein [bacterium]
MWNELDTMLDKAWIGQWSWVKWLFFGTAIFSWIGYYLAKRRKTGVHISLNSAVYGMAWFLFIYGVVTRGLMGGVGTVKHTGIFWPVLILHIGAGGIFLLLATSQIWSGVTIAQQPRDKRDVNYRSHRRMGIWAVYSLSCSVVLSLFL